MYVVANNFMLRKFKTIQIFKLDLGFNLTGAQSSKQSGQFTIKIKDEFVKKYQTLTNRYINKFGEIGTLKFYEDTTLGNSDIHIYNKEQIYEILVTNEDLIKDPYDYLTEIIMEIERIENEIDTESNIVRDIVYTNVPDDLVKPDINLPKNEYIEQLVKNRRLQDKILSQKQ